MRLPIPQLPLHRARLRVARAAQAVVAAVPKGERSPAPHPAEVREPGPPCEQARSATTPPKQAG